VTRPWESLFDPGCVAVVGASAAPGSWGRHLASGALAGRSRRRVHLVNRRGGELDGVAFVPSLLSVAERVDLVVVAVPPGAFESTVDDALAVGATAIVGVTAGVPRDAERALARRVRDAGAILLGPNAMGVFDASTRLRLLWGDLPAGRIALLSQSGNLALEVGAIAARGGLGFSRFSSVGDAADVGLTDLLPVVAAGEGTRAVAVYAESIGDGRRFLKAAADVVAAGTPVYLLAGGRTEAGARAAQSHTGALAGTYAVLRAGCRQAGVSLVDTPTELVEATRAAVVRRASGPVPARVGRPGRRVAIVGDGGGHGIVAADLAASAGLTLVPFSARLADRLADWLPVTASVGNPVDLAGGGERDLWNYARVVTAVAASGEVDLVVLTGYFGGYGADGPELSAVEGEVAEAIAGAAVPVLVHSMAAASATSARLEAAGVPVWAAIEHAVAAAARWDEAAPAVGGALVAGAVRGATLPGGAVPVAGNAPSAVPAAVTPPGYGGAGLADRVLVGRYGIAVTRSLRIRNLEELLAAGTALGYPVALKASGLAHKSDVGGVALGLADPDALIAAWQRMCERVSASAYTVEEMVDVATGVEMLVGARRDPVFGPVVVVAAGGIFAELLDDTAVGLAPLSPGDALELVRQLRIFPRLDGARGGPVLDTPALAGVVVAAGRLVAEQHGVADLDLNPVLVTASGATALDVHIGWSAP
jgi:acyl-CoA synthetase (NDP forming)